MDGARLARACEGGGSAGTGGRPAIGDEWCPAQPSSSPVYELAPRPGWAREHRGRRLFTNGMRQSTVWLVFRDWCGCSPILRIRLRQGHPDCRSIVPLFPTGQAGFARRTWHWLCRCWNDIDRSRGDGEGAPRSRRQALSQWRGRFTVKDLVVVRLQELGDCSARSRELPRTGQPAGWSRTIATLL